MQDNATIDARSGGDEVPHGEGSASGQRTPLLNLALLLVATTVALLIAEVAVRLFDLWPHQRAAAWPLAATESSASEAAKRNPAQTRGEDQLPDKPFSRWIVHPYRGITPRPGFRTEDGPLPNVLGIVSRVDDPRQLAEENLVVGIFGGSVARSTGLLAEPAIAAALEATLPASAPPVRVVNFAVSGYKQPQQLFLLAELFLLETPLDVVVNIDGYNEAVLGATDALEGHHPLYPRHDFWLSALGAAAGTLSQTQVELTARVIDQRRRTSELRDALQRTPVLRRLALARAVVGTLVQQATIRAVTAEEELRRLPISTPDRDLFRLADPCLRQQDQCWDLIVGLWTKSSELMEAVAKQAGAEYFHVLQPNQYVAGSKKLSPEELERSWNPDLDWSRAAARGYPLLREAGRTLRQKGVRFYDLTQIFAAHPETIYRDVCCHYHPHGYEILGTEIGRLVGEALAAGDGGRNAGASPSSPGQW